MTAQTGLGAVAVLLLGIAAYVSLFASPPDAFQGEYVRIMYAHVPNAWVAYLAFAITFAASALYLWKRRPAYDHVAHSATELGVLFTGLALLTGSIWGRPVWGTWWTWDARLVTTAMLFLIYTAALLVRDLSDDPLRGARLAAVIGIVGFLDVPIIHYSVVWFRTLHQPASIAPGSLKIAPPMLLALMLSLLAFTVLFMYLLRLRTSLARRAAVERPDAWPALHSGRRERHGAGHPPRCAAGPVHRGSGGGGRRDARCRRYLHRPLHYREAFRGIPAPTIPMMAMLGFLSLMLAVGCAAGGLVTLLAGHRLRHDPARAAWGRAAAAGLFAGVTLAVVMMEAALIGFDFSIRYVAANVNRATPLLFRVAGLWGALEGSILLWAWILAALTLFVAVGYRGRHPDLIPSVLTVLFAIALFFVGVMIGPANPFARLPVVPPDGRGLNPLLQNHLLMAIHPPLLYARSEERRVGKGS